MKNPFLEKILLANPNRNYRNLDRRCLKMGEEYGEAAQAILAVTSPNNNKNKTWEDVIEELVDTFILDVDMLLTKLPTDNPNITPEEIEDRIEAMLDRKLAKWATKMDKQSNQDDSE